MVNTMKLKVRNQARNFYVVVLCVGPAGKQLRNLSVLNETEMKLSYQKHKENRTCLERRTTPIDQDLRQADPPQRLDGKRRETNKNKRRQNGSEEGNEIGGSGSGSETKSANGRGFPSPIDQDGSR